MISLEQLHWIERIQAPIVMMFYWLIYLLEMRNPLRDQSFKSSHYWNNMALNGLNFVILGLYSHFIVTLSFSMHVKEQGLYNLVGLGALWAIPLQVIAYDFLSYWVHRLFHRFDALWSLHRSHHSDGMMDATTGFRFHPGEGVVRLVIQGFFIFLTGMSPYAIVLHSLIAAPIFLVSHSNWKMSESFESTLSRVFVLPREHSVHHHPVRKYHDSNYGTIFMWWDHLFSTYTDPKKIRKFYVGLSGYKADEAETLRELLQDPVRSKQLS